jgi:hypothetical protein|tara:strand:+ start:8359 stop:8541 length:183 start_codon:yes stop_codon:yes gene_type:complete
MEDKRIVQGKLMNTHRMVINEIADIKSKNIEPTEEDQKKIKKLEGQLKLIADSLYRLYNE